ncbi:MAG: flagellar biosynthesis anti-sigma factor FlgM [Gammaproteobacteria bacterium]|nr:flagellar biosynthesis anti-sigma factor FlgM [Gammaproteobacteria bacterium]MCH9717771.1 flagellar biosynthesis anti-sigma factor FlgM [Gammaproteobacteria bacterium]MCH9762886.1 flagellar biosynthesis anti-sigma factor FlgM [Gammaproteobacteria bacterium]
MKENQENLALHEEKIKQLKQAIDNNTFAINSDCIASALLEAQQRIQQPSSIIEQPEMA